MTDTVANAATVECLSWIEPVAHVETQLFMDGVSTIISKILPVGTSLYSAATVERLVQERDDCREAIQVLSSTLNQKQDQLAAMTQERDALNATIMHMNDVCNEQIAASQAREQQLREALEGSVEWARPMRYAPINERPDWFDIARKALSLPQDDTALRQWGAKLLRKTGDKLILKAIGATNIPMLTGSVRDYLTRKADELEAGK